MSWTGVKTDKRYGTRAVRILDMIGERDGMTFQEIQAELYRMSHGTDEPYDKKRDRGWWCTQLYGSSYGRPGLLSFYCVKDPTTRKWKRKDFVPHLGRPFATMKRAQEDQDTKLTDQICSGGVP